MLCVKRFPLNKWLWFFVNISGHIFTPVISIFNNHIESNNFWFIQPRRQ